MADCGRREGQSLSCISWVSTDKQGRSGLGSGAQRVAVEGYLNGGRWTLVAEYVEAESGQTHGLAEAREGSGTRQGYSCERRVRKARSASS